MLTVAEQGATGRHRDPLSVTDILSELSVPVARGIVSFHLFSSIASTNAYLLATTNAQSVASGMHVCVADTQTQGHGQHGRPWASPRGNICMSVAARTGLTQIQSNWLPLMIAVGVAEMLSSLGAEEIQVKWPNDVYHRLGKLAGVLIERKNGLTVIGIGLNVTSLKSNTDSPQPGGRQRATLHEVLPLVPPRNRIIAYLLEMVCEVVKHCAGTPLSFLQTRWNKFDMLAGRHLIVSSPAGFVKGRAKGVNANAELLLDTGQQLKNFSSANIRIHWQSCFLT